MTERERELLNALEKACSNMAQVRTAIEDGKVNDRRFCRILNTAEIKDIIRKHRTNEIVISKSDNSTLTRIDITYNVYVRLLTDIPEDRAYFTFSAGNHLGSVSIARQIAKNASAALEYHGIEHDVVDMTGE